MMGRPIWMSSEKRRGRMPGRIKLQLSLALASVGIAAVFVAGVHDSWLRTVGGVLLLFIALVQSSLIATARKTR